MAGFLQHPLHHRYRHVPLHGMSRCHKKSGWITLAHDGLAPPHDQRLGAKGVCKQLPDIGPARIADRKPSEEVPERRKGKPDDLTACLAPVAQPDGHVQHAPMGLAMWP